MALPQINATRRSVLLGFAAAPVAALPSVAASAAALSPLERFNAALAEIQAAAFELWPDIDTFRTRVGQPGNVHEGMPVLLTAFRRAEPKYEKWSGAGLYEVQHGKAHPIYWVERAPSGSYRAWHSWRGKRQGGVKRFTDATLKIIRKMPDSGVH